MCHELSHQINDNLQKTLDDITDDIYATHTL